MLAAPEYGSSDHLYALIPGERNKQAKLCVSGGTPAIELVNTTYSVLGKYDDKIITIQYFQPMYTIHFFKNWAIPKSWVQIENWAFISLLFFSFFHLQSFLLPPHSILFLHSSFLFPPYFFPPHFLFFFPIFIL